MPTVEGYGVEPVPDELRTVGWRDLFAINFTFFLNPVMYVLGALAVVGGGLPLPWAVAAAAAGQALAYACLAVVAQAGVDYGLPGQVAMRGSLGFWGARILSSPYRMVAATYWFAAQALAGGLGLQAVVEAMSGRHVGLVPLALALGAFHAVLAVLGFDVMRYVLRIVLPLSLALTGVLVGLYLAADDPRYAVARVWRSPDQHLTWAGFAAFVTVMCGASLTLVPSIADFCRYTPTRRDMRIGLVASSILAVALTTFVGGYAAAAIGGTNPFVSVVDLTASKPLLVLLAVAIVVQGIAANITNVYTSGLSLVNSVPALGRLRATVLVAVAAVVLAGFPSFVDHAQRWITHLGNVAAPLTGVVLADYLVVNRGRLDVAALFDPSGRYRFRAGVNAAALAAVAAGVAVYYALPQAWLKVAWGLGVGAAAYLALRRLEALLPAGRPAPTEAVAE
ncbi:MAG TPA: cytosine permease [Gaiellaceae bacterium]|nr:cytosine permease [Gaiellaceae bacterium]